jgi:hypothetical protein
MDAIMKHCRGVLPCAILCTMIYRLLGELGAAGLRAPPERVEDPEPDLDNASEGNAVNATRERIARDVTFLRLPL